MSMTVSEVEASTGVPANTVRWYLRRGLLRPRRNQKNGYFEFSPADLRALAFIRRAKTLGFTLKEIVSMFEMSRRRQTPCPMVRDIIARRLMEFDTEIEELISMQRGMKRALRLWRRLPDGIPDGDEVCRLIEAIGGGLDLGVAHRFIVKRPSAPVNRKRSPPKV